ncbi:MAG TPA: hypothetical protein VNJ08_05980 [Bacteriovoracaceae bacterium]|nr:hypothetical protein [Bacteriovoracaceae bacterium]
MKTFISLPLIVLVLASCGKVKEMPTFPSFETANPLFSNEIEVKIERVDELKADFSNYKEFVNSLNFHKLTFSSKKASLEGFTVECHDPSIKDIEKSKSSYLVQTSEKDLVVFTMLKTFDSVTNISDFGPVDLKCVLQGNGSRITKTVHMKKSMVNPLNYTGPLDLDVLLLNDGVLVTQGKDVTIKAKKLVSRKGKIASSLLNTGNFSKSGIPVPGGQIDLVVTESIGDLTIELIGQDAIQGIEGGDTGNLKMALPNLENLKLKVKYFKGLGGLGIVLNGEIGEPANNGRNGMSRIELTDTKETFEFDSDWMN